MELNNLNLKSGSKKNRAENYTLDGNQILEHPPEMSDTYDPTTKFVKFCGENGKFRISYEALGKGLLCVGSTGSGKTTMLNSMLDQIISDLNPQDVMLIVDSKGDYFKRYYDRNNPNHILISTKQEHTGMSLGWNVFDELKNEYGEIDSLLEMRADEISRALFNGLESESQPFFPIAATQLFKTVIIAMIRDAIRAKDFSKCNNKELFSFLSNAEDAKKYYELVCKYPSLRYIKTFLGNGTSNQALGVLGYLQSMQSQKLISIFRDPQPAGEFSIRRLIGERNKIIFLEWDIAYADSLSEIFSLFFDLAIKTAISGDTRGNKWFICDEFSLLPYVSSIQHLLNYGRSFGCKTIVGIQSVSQIKDNYEDYEADSVLAGFVNAFCFKAVDYETRTYISERFGKAFKVYNFGGDNLTREGFSVEDSDAHNLNVGEAFIDICESKPFRFQFKNTI